MMKDVRAQTQREQQQLRQVRCRFRRHGADGGLLRRRKPKKKSVNAAQSVEKSLQMLPVLLPHVFFKNMVCSGLIDELMLAGM